jgi:ABC-type multidrug transport system ATPase subunit
MKQKLALSCALVHRPDLLLLDEPTTGVDAVSRREFWDQLDALKRSGLTIVVSTPYMDEALRCDRVALIQEGRILDIDAPRSIGDRFRHTLVGVRSRDRHKLLAALRAMPNVHSVYPFGEELHYADRRQIPADQLAMELQASLRQAGFQDAEVKPTTAGIEDVFMELMSQPQEHAA